MAGETKYKLAILDDYQHIALDCADWKSLEKVGVEITTFHEAIPKHKLAETLKPFNFLSILRERTSFPRELLNQLPNLKLILSNGRSNAAIDVEAANDNGIIVTKTAGAQIIGNSTLEHIWALILSAARNIPAYDRGVKSNAPWQAVGSNVSKQLPFGLKGKTIGLVGLGSLGSSTAAIARAFGMKVIVWSPHLTVDRLTDEQMAYVTVVSKENLFKHADIVSVHLVLSPSTRGIIGAKELALMKPDSIFVNVSRGPLVDEEALLEVLREKRIRGAALDVYDIEPLPTDSEWRKLGDHVVVTPHVGYVELPTYREFYDGAVSNVLAYIEGRHADLILQY